MKKIVHYFVSYFKKSNEVEKVLHTLERDESSGSMGLSQESEFTMKTRNALINDFRRLREDRIEEKLKEKLVMNKLLL